MKAPIAWLRPTPFKFGCLVILAAVLFFHSFGTDKPRLLEALDKRAADTMFHWRGAEPHGDRVVIVDIDERSLRQVGQWPWPRDRVAKLLANIGAGGPAAVGLDMVFAEPDRTSPENWLPRLSQRHPEAFADDRLARLLRDEEFNHDLILGDTLAQLPSVLGYVFDLREEGASDPGLVPFHAARIRLSPAELGFADLSLIGGRRAILNVAEISQGLSEGFFNVFPDVDGTVRRVPLLMLLEGLPYPSLALELARIGSEGSTLTIHAEPNAHGARHALLGVALEGRFIPTDERGQLNVNFRGPPYTFPYLSAAEVLEGHHRETLRNKIVLVGTSAAGLLDLRPTPFGEVFPGVEIHANAVDNLLAGDPLVYDIYTEIGLTHATVIGGGLLLTFLLVHSGPLAGGLAALGLIAGSVAANYHLFFLDNRVVGLVYPLATLVLLFMVVTLANYAFEGRRKRFLSKAFGQYVPPELVREMVDKSDDLALGGETREMTVLFSDVRGFTGIAEGLEATELTRLMNEMLTPLTHIIHRHRGTIDKYMGDAIMAFWGAPLYDREHARHAVQAALEMAAAVPGIQKKFQARGWPAIRMGVGINSGPMNVGNMGSEFRMAYTVLGDAVNLGSRLEGLTKHYGVEIVISQYTRQQVPDYACRELDLVRVKGKDRATAIFEPLGPAGQLDPDTAAALEKYHRALALFRRRDFTAALELFTELHRADPDRRLYHLYRDRCHRFLRDQPSH